MVPRVFGFEPMADLTSVTFSCAGHHWTSTTGFWGRLRSV